MVIGFSYYYTSKKLQISKLKTSKLETILYGIDFYRVKAKNLIKLSKIIAERGSVPDTLPELLKLPGVGRKTANIVLARAFGKNTIGVDVHVHRISNRLGIVKTKNRDETEKELMKKIPKKYIRKLNLTFVAFGQTICVPRKPNCNSCSISKICSKVGVV